MTEVQIPRVAIIGAGPTGYTAAITAINLGYIVELVDPWIFAEPNLETEIHSNLKTRFGSTAMHEYPTKFLRSQGSQIVAASSVVGGFSTVWGAGLSFDTSIFKEDYSTEIIDDAEKTVRLIFKGFMGSHFVSERFKKLYRNTNTGFTPSLLAVSGTRCTLTGRCMEGCSKNAIWSCEEPWKQLIRSGVTLRRGFATEIREDNDQVYVKIDFKDQTETHKYDYILVACGAVASASLGQRSGYFPDSVELGETAISYIPIVLANQIRPYTEDKFTLSQVFYTKKVPSANSEVWMSLFESSIFLKQKAELKLNKVVKFIPKILWGYIGVAIHYTPESLSNKVIISKENGVSLVSTNKSSTRTGKYFRNLFSITRRDFYLNGLFFHPLIRLNGKSSDSYHLGHITLNNREILDRAGKSWDGSKVSFVDSLSLKRLPSGPITAIAMMNAYLKTTLLLKRVSN